MKYEDKTYINNNASEKSALAGKIYELPSTYNTILEYTLLRKIQEAKKLIREDRYNFSQISDRLAFDNPHYFSRVFKRITNITPSEYKKSVKNP